MEAGSSQDAGKFSGRKSLLPGFNVPDQILVGLARTVGNRLSPSLTRNRTEKMLDLRSPTREKSRTHFTEISGNHTEIIVEISAVRVCPHTPKFTPRDTVCACMSGPCRILG